MADSVNSLRLARYVVGRVELNKDRVEAHSAFVTRGGLMTCPARSAGARRARTSRWLLLGAFVLAVGLLALPAAAAAAPLSTGDGGWVWQNPLPQGNNMRSVCFADASHGWTVGDGGTIFATSDGGTTWSAQVSSSKADLYSVAFADASHGWAVGASVDPNTDDVSGVILATSDGGAQWVAQDVPAGIIALSSVTCADAGHAWATGRDGGYERVILTTADHGAHWSKQAVPHGDTDLNAVSFADTSHGWAVDGSGTILGTTDGGAAWQAQYSGRGDEFSGLSFTDASHGWAVGGGDRGGLILATTDGGAHWNAQNVPSDVWNLQTVSFADADHGWATDGSTIIGTSDGGATWTAERFDFAYGLHSVAAADQGHAVIVGRSGTILATTDSGATWVSRSSDSAALPEGGLEDLRAVAFADANDGWALDDSRTLLATTDGGTHWGLRYQAPNDDLSALSFADASHGWTVGWDNDTQAGAILATTDGGAHWSKQAVPSGTSDVRAVAFADTSHGWAVDGSGTILGTTDGGAAWNAQYSAPQDDFSGLSFTNASHGWAVGGGDSGGIVLATTDGGTQWSPQSVPSDVGGLTAVAFANTSHGWAVDGSGTILATADGGLHWGIQHAALPYGCLWLSGVSFADASHGWAVGGGDSGGFILATTDGGTNWITQDSGTANSLFGVASSDATHAWVVGDDGTILATTTGGSPPVLDTTPPTTTVSGADALWHNTAVTLTLTPTDNVGGSGMSGGQATTQYKIGTGSWQTGTTVVVPAPTNHSGDGAQVVSFHSRDAAGNWETVKTVTVKIDTTSPTTGVSGADALWHNSAVTLTLTPTDNTGGSGMSGGQATTQYKIGTGSWTTGTTVDVPAPANHSGDGAQVVSYQSRDAAGNWETAKTVTVKIDTTAPTTTAEGLQSTADSAWQKQAGLVTLLAADSLSQVGTTYYTIDGGTTQTYSGPFSVTGQGGHTIIYWSVDLAGNTEGVHSGYLSIDSKAPSATVKALTVKAAAARKGKTLRIKVTIADPKPSCGSATLVLVLTNAKHKKLATVTFKNEPTNKALTLSEKLTRALAKGTYYMTVKATDAAGNVQTKVAAAKLTVK